MRHVPSQSLNLSRLVKTTLSPTDKVLIFGSTGWLGQTMHRLLDSSGVPTLLVGSRGREVPTPYGSQFVRALNWAEIADFEPTIVCDFAFLTREHLDTMPLEVYEARNRALIEVGLRALSLETVSTGLAASSGAALRPSQALTLRYGYDPYSVLKQETENRYLESAENLGKQLCVVRPYSVSGNLVTKPRGFAISDFIFQALSTKTIKIESHRPIHRRYCDLDDLLACAITAARESPSPRILDSGGDLVDLEQLARIVVSEIDESVRVTCSTDYTLEPDAYYSDNTSWNEICRSSEFSPLSLNDQVSKMIDSFELWGHRKSSIERKRK